MKLEIKKIYIAVCCILMTVQVSFAQQMNVKNADGTWIVLNTSSIKYATFIANNKWFDIKIDGEKIIEDDKISTSCTIGLAPDSEVKTLSVPIELGICFSRDNTTPTIENDCIPLGTELKNYTFTISSLYSGTTYYFRGYVKLGNTVLYGDVDQATTSGIKPRDNSRIINGHKFVDLGLASGMLWAETNIGAKTAADEGDRFAWGETETKSEFTKSNYKSSLDSKYNKKVGKTILDVEDDAASANWAVASCRMPTKNEIEELINSDNCVWTKDTIIQSNGSSITGFKVTSISNGNSIFLRAHNDFGYNYWSSEATDYIPSSDIYTSKAYSLCLYMKSWQNHYVEESYRYYGCPIRPIADLYTPNQKWFIIKNCGENKTSEMAITASFTFALSENIGTTEFSGTPEIGVCYSKDNASPTIDDDSMTLGTELKDYTFTLPSLISDTQYYFRGYVKLDDKVFYGDVNQATTDVVTINGHKFIDLGLPSGKLWAETNIGAETAADDGDYFAWGETKPKSDYTWNNYKFVTMDALTKYNSTDGKTILDLEDDAAYVNWGTLCQMPSNDDILELCNSDNCTWTTDTIIQSNGSSIKGYRFKSNRNGNSIFLPASGCDRIHKYGERAYYWSNELDESVYSQHYSYSFDSFWFENTSHKSKTGNYVRSSGLTVRPVVDLYNSQNKWFNIVNYGVESTTGTTITAFCGVDMAVVINKLPATPEIGVCYSKDNASPTIEDDCILLGTALKNNTFTIPSLAPNTTYYFRIYVKLADIVNYGDVDKATTLSDINHNNVICNGHKFVDLGLPSGRLWSQTNIGAETITDDGDYFAWGETESKSEYKWATNKYVTSTSSGIVMNKYNKSDGKTVLDEEDDAAYVNLGSPSHMPTDEDFNELLDPDNCTWSWTSLPKSKNLTINCYKVTSTKNGVSIYLPASGYIVVSSIKGYNSGVNYWSNTLNSDNLYADCLTFTTSPALGNQKRCFGLPIRPVADSFELLKITNNGIEATTDTTITASCSVVTDSNLGVNELPDGIEVGVCYSSDHIVPTVDDCNSLVLGTEINDYSFTLPSLNPGTAYYYRVYVKLNQKLIVYGELVQATTLGTKQDVTFNGVTSCSDLK